MDAALSLKCQIKILGIVQVVWLCYFYFESLERIRSDNRMENKRLYQVLGKRVGELKCGVHEV